MELLSKENPKIKQLSALLRSAKERREAGLFVLEGLRLCRDAAENGYAIRSLFLSDGFLAAHGEEAASLSVLSRETYSLPDALFARVADTVSPQGVLCVCARQERPAALVSGGKYGVLEAISDPANLGAISRSAEAFGLNALLTVGGCDPHHPKALRASMGALLRLPVWSFPDAEACFSVLEKNHIPTFAAVLSGADRALQDCDFSAGGAVFIGNEAAGLTAQTAARCSVRATIPMAGRAESLNAAGAAGIFFYEMTRGRQERPV